MRKKPSLLLASFLIINFFPISSAFAQTTSLPSPTSATALANAKLKWEQNMLTWGAKHCATLASTKDGPLDPVLNTIYYDGTRVYYQIADYTGDSKWLSCVNDAVYVYRDRYARANKPYGQPSAWGAVAAWQNFPKGMRMHFERTGDTISKETVNMLARFAGGGENLAYDPYLLSAYGMDPRNPGSNYGDWRGVSYWINAFIDAKALGYTLSAANTQRYKDSVDALHRFSDTYADPTKWGQAQIAPFMYGLIAEAMIRQHVEVAPDSRTIPSLKKVLDFLMQDSATTLGAYYAPTKSMLYALNPDLGAAGGSRSPAGAPDLNMLIAPAYTWLWMQTGDIKYRDFGDVLFEGSLNAFLGIGKQFDQSYKWAFDYMKWRYGITKSGTTPPPPPPSPPSTKFIVGDRIKTTYGLNVRATPNGAIVGSQTYNVLGTVIGGPQVSGGYTWWQINFDSGSDGWSAENNLVKVSAPSPPTVIELNARIAELLKLIQALQKQIQELEKKSQG